MSTPLPDDRLREAMTWRARLKDAGLESSAAFEAWIAADPAHAAAWADTEDVWAFLDDSAVSHSPDLMTIRRKALAAAERQGRRRPVDRRRWLQPLAAGFLIAVLLGASGGGVIWLAQRPDVYRTTLGERRVIPLPDGSKVSLDSNSEVRVRYAGEARKLTLVRGQARFDVARDVRRPFSVAAAGRTVVAVGTAFNVDMLGRTVRVTLLHGQVVILNDDDEPPVRTALSAPSRGVRLNPGEAFTAAPAASPVVTAASVERVTAWETGQLMFDNEPLGSVAERISRYAAHPVRVAPQVAGLRISGVFDTGDVAGFVQTMGVYLPVRAVPDADGGVTLQPDR
ncbi:FecR family protein [Brevundimonas sp. SORGH_AS_0993]|uniref:FecR family protein n=1 Tax=Brevundimonas sp. SORGH_AS_0993 TaxID=3041794 RepID=UPI0027882B1F|nr:FecR domain-containing protein [Brevundimonas sp. SORGH_AS_0993]MDQ1153427.1 transmembrane sensor [Brevundimonas sp. SORGH_AS_0993]